MVALHLVRESNARLRELGPGLVGLFVGATSGIGEATAKAFVQHAVSPRVYLVGRNAAAAERIIDECKALNKDGKVEFIKADVSELKEVDRVCKEIQQREKHINLIVQSQGTFSIRGPDLNSEGLDRKFTLHFYSRMRFIFNLLPLLRNASTATPNFSRSVSVFSPGTESKIDINDLGLEKSYSVAKTAAHTTLMNDFMVEEFASREPGTTFIHAYPSGVETGLSRDLPLWARVPMKGVLLLSKPFLVPIEETGQRQLFHATSGIFPPAGPVGASATASGVSLSKGLKVADGADGKQASGAYYLNWNSDTIKQKALVHDYRKQGYSGKIWDYTMGVFQKVDASKEVA